MGFWRFAAGTNNHYGPHGPRSRRCPSWTVALVCGRLERGTADSAVVQRVPLPVDGSRVHRDEKHGSDTGFSKIVHQPAVTDLRRRPSGPCAPGVRASPQASVGRHKSHPLIRQRPVGGVQKLRQFHQAVTGREQPNRQIVERPRCRSAGAQPRRPLGQRVLEARAPLGLGSRPMEMTIC